LKIQKLFGCVKKNNKKRKEKFGNKTKKEEIKVERNK